MELAYLSAEYEEYGLDTGCGILGGQILRVPLLQDSPLSADENRLSSLF